MPLEISKSNRVTIKDIARHTGYSIATVSRVLNERGVFYSQETSSKIKKAIKDLNYHPDAIARGLKTKRTNNIVFLEPWNSEFFSEIFLGIQEAANEAGYSVAIFSSNYDLSQEERNIRTILSNMLDGVIISSSVLNLDSIRKLVDQGIPLVMIEKIVNQPDIPSISIKNLDISREAISYLVALGHDRIGFMGEPLEIGKVSSRFRGYKKALEDNHINFNPAYVFVDQKFRGEKYSSSYQYITENLEKIKKCTAIFVTSDIVSIVLIKVLNQSGLRVPRDISIIGFDGLEVSKYITPTLTTVVQPRYEMGLQAMKLLLKIINGEKVGSVELKAQLYIGESTAPPVKT